LTKGPPCRSGEFGIRLQGSASADLSSSAGRAVMFGKSDSLKSPRGVLTFSAVGGVASYQGTYHFD